MDRSIARHHAKGIARRMNAEQEKSLHIIAATPLVSIDLIIYNPDGKILLGKRSNRPAKDFWFVPGGRIKKNEHLDNALRRISRQELGIVLNRQDGLLLGAYDHIYPDNYLAIAGVNTHYVALGYEFKLTQHPKLETDDQHTEIKWFARDELLACDCAHDNSKAYVLSDTDQR
jgi:colanic acid biosynthesis protein WcaH